MDWHSFTDQQLLGLYSELMGEMRTRNMIRSSNNPVADYTENLVSKSLGLELAGQSTSGHDAIDTSGIRYQIKGRRLTPQNPSTQLSAIRNLQSNPFDLLAAVVFNPDFSVSYAALIPIEIVKELGRYTAHTNSHTFLFKRIVLEDPRVQTITSRLAT